MWKTQVKKFSIEIDCDMNKTVDLCVILIQTFYLFIKLTLKEKCR